MIRPTETVPLEVPEAESYADIEAGLRAQVPEGYTLADIRVSQPRGTSYMVGTGTAQKAEIREITVERRDQLQASIPEGWQALSIRPA